jgi:hypothetical protein
VLREEFSLLPYQTDFRYHLIKGWQSKDFDGGSLEEGLRMAAVSPGRAEVTLYDDQPSSFGTEEIEKLASRLRNPYPRHSRESIHHHLRLLGLLSRIASGLDSDINIFIRADLVPVGTVSFKKYLAPASDSIITPNWHTWGGVNDRVAIVPKKFKDVYFGRLAAAHEFLRSGRPVHGETFLSSALGNTPVSAVIDDKFARTTSAGQIRKEDFSRGRHPLRTYLADLESTFVRRRYE